MDRVMIFLFFACGVLFMGGIGWSLAADPTMDIASRILGGAVMGIMGVFFCIAGILELFGSKEGEQA